MENKEVLQILLNRQLKKDLMEFCKQNDIKAGPLIRKLIKKEIYKKGE